MSGPENGGKTRAFEALRASEELHRATLSNISDAVFMADDTGKFTFVCPNVDVIFGYTPDEVFAHGRLGAFLGDDLFDPAELTARGEIQNVEREVTAKNGARRHLLIHLKTRVDSRRHGVAPAAISPSSGRPSVNWRWRMDLSARRALTLVGELAASIVHEIQQPLTAIAANTEAAVTHVSRWPKGTTGEVGAILADIQEATAFAAGIIERLRNIARKRPMAPQSIDLNELVAGVARLVSPDALRRRVHVFLETTPGLPKIVADGISLQHVILNLVMNAMEAMDQVPGNREVKLETRRSNGSVELSVLDTGPGITEEMLPRMFDAFVTSKRESVGLGLSIARSIVEAHHGSITANNTGHGASFVVALPVS
jgi:PAS domain S-box-containing protein